jgi:phage shock protein PspC (stress-responsive transcriptional regulator)
VLGAAIVSLFGGDVNFSETDPDLLILIGVVASFSIFAIIYYVVQWIKKKSESNKDEKDNDE